VPVGGAEYVEVPVAERVRLATGGAPQRTTLRLAASTRAPVAVRRLALYTAHTRSTQPCIPPGSLNRVPASAGVTAGMSPLPGGR